MIVSNQREHRRIGPPVNTVIFTDDTFGQIIDISPGGVALKFIDLDTPVKNRDTVDIFFGDLMMDNVKVSLVWENRTATDPKDSLIISHAGLKFENLTAKQRVMLDFYINQHTDGNA